MNRVSLARVAALAATLGMVTIGVEAQAPGEFADRLARVGNRVREYYSRAQSIVCLERVRVQPIHGWDLASDGFGRVLEFELRVEWDASPDGDQPPEATIIRELLRVNGREPRPKDDPGCLDPKSGALEPLAILLPHHRDEYTFAWTGAGRLKDKRTTMLDYKPRATGPIQGTWNGDCVSIEAPGRTKGRIWVDEETNDVLRLDEQLTGQYEYRVPPDHWGSMGPLSWVVERSDSSIRYRPVAFHDPEETIMLPESIDSLTIFKGGGAQSYRISQTFADYKRFITGARIVK